MGLVKGNAGRQITVGGYTFDWDPMNNTSDILLMGACITTNLRCTFRQPNASAGYVVPASKTLYIMAFKAVNAVAVASEPCLLYGDADTGYTNTTAFTNPVYNAGVTTGDAGLGTAVVGGILEFAPHFSIPTGKYPSVQSQSTGQAFVIFAYGKLK
jgi:hypothetical protein